MIDVGVLFQQVVAALARPPRATCRLQLVPSVGFDAVAALAPYLAALGVSHAYLSPCFRCGPRSSHGYDVSDHNAFNPELGSTAAFDRMVAADPDNRRPVDFARRQPLLDALRSRIPEGPADLSGLCGELLESWPDGRVKVYLTHRALTCRRAHPQLFGSGAYLPLAASGERAERLIALARLHGPDALIVAVPRLPARLTGFTGRLPIGTAAWGQTWVALDDPRLEGAYRDRFSGRRIGTEMRQGVPALEAGAPIAGDTFLLILNAHHEAIPFVLPAHRARVRWELVLDARQWEVGPRAQTFRAGDQYPLEGRSLAALRLRAARRRR